MPQVFTGNALDHLDQVFGAAAQFGSTAADIWNKHTIEQAQIDTMHMQAQLEQDTNNKLLELQQRGDYENWNKDIDNFLQEKKSQMSDKNSPYYCKNNATAKMYDSVLLNNRNQLQSKVAQMSLNYQQQQSRLTVDDTVNMNKTMYKGQELIDKSEEALKLGQANGLYTPEQYAAKQKELYISTLQSDIKDLYTQYAASHPEQSFNDVEEYVKKNAPTYKMNNDENYSKTLGEDGATAIKSGMQLAKQQIIATQTENNNQLRRENADIVLNIATGNGDAQSNYATVLRQLNKIKGYQNLTLDAGDRKAREDELLSLLEASKDGNNDKTKVTALENLLKDDTENFVKAAIRGSNNENGKGFNTMKLAQEAYAKEMQKAYKNAFGKNWEGEYNKDYAARMSDFVLSWQKEVGNQRPELKQSFVNLSKLPEKITGTKTYGKIFKKDPGYAQEIKDELESFIWDELSTTDFATVSVDTINKITDDFSNRIFAKELDYLDYFESDAARAAKDYESDKGFNRGLNVSDKDLIFTDVQGQTRYIGGERTKQALENIEKKEAQDLSVVLGTENIRKVGYGSTNNGTDMDSKQIYESDGKLYRYEAGDKNNPKLMTSTDGKTWTEADRTPKKTAKEAAKEEKNKAYERVTNTLEQRNKAAIELLGYDYPLNGSNLDAWQQLPVEVKLEEAQKIVSNPKEYKRIIEEINKKN